MILSSMSVFLKKSLQVFLVVSILGSCISESTKVHNPDDRAMVAILDSSFRNNIIGVWYPLVIDTAGGYYSNLSHQMKVMDDQPKMLVTQSRHIWTSSQAAMFYNDTSYLKYACHGVSFLIKHMWDSIYGGFFNLRSREGGYLDESYRNNKMAYGNTFAIYGLVSYYNASKDTVALRYAKKTFLWLEKNSHDKKYGGYVDPMGRQGNWLSRQNKKQPVAWKDYNSTIHLLEAFTELYKVWPDSLVKVRLNELLVLVRDTFTNPKGYLHLNFTEDWKLVTNRDSGEEVIHKNRFIDHVSFGHDVETAFLMLEASHTLRLKKDTLTLKIARRMVDHALANGLDNSSGGFFEAGYYFPGKDSITILEKNAQWWVQAEGLNALLLMSVIFPEVPEYKKAFLNMWNCIERNYIDKQYGEWFFKSLQYEPEIQTAPKATIWKANYHNGRALMNCIRLLKNENEVANHFREVNKQR